MQKPQIVSKQFFNLIISVLMIYCNILSNAYADKLNDASYRYNYNTNITFPDIFSSTVFKPVFTKSHKFLFYTGQKDDQYVAGYFSAQNFLGWQDFKFPPHGAYANKTNYIQAVSDGPQNSLVVLSYVNDHGQLFSTSYDDGKSWHTTELTSTNFEYLVNTNSSNLNRLVAYSSKHNLFYTSHDAFNWQQWAFPNTCFEEEHCTYQNKFFNSSHNDYVLLQARNAHNILTNKLYLSSNLQDWYLKSVPFIHETVEKALKSKYDILAFSTRNKDNEHKLWLTPDLSSWAQFKLPTDAKLADLKVNSETNILLLLAYSKNSECSHDDNSSNSDNTNSDIKCRCLHEPELSTELVILDPESNKLELVEKFEGEVTSITAVDNKTYLSGNFFNHEDHQQAALVAISNL